MKEVVSRDVPAELASSSAMRSLESWLVLQLGAPCQAVEVWD